MSFLDFVRRFPIMAGTLVFMAIGFLGLVVDAVTGRILFASILIGMAWIVGVAAALLLVLMVIEFIRTRRWMASRRATWCSILAVAIYFIATLTAFAAMKVITSTFTSPLEVSGLKTVFIHAVKTLMFGSFSVGLALILELLIIRRPAVPNGEGGTP